MTIVQNRSFPRGIFHHEEHEENYPDGLIQHFVLFVSFVVKLGCGFPRCEGLN
jgi:hypothetical protein